MDSFNVAGVEAKKKRNGKRDTVSTNMRHELTKIHLFSDNKNHSYF